MRDLSTTTEQGPVFPAKKGEVNGKFIDIDKTVRNVDRR